MWPFMKDKPRPPHPPYGSINEIEDYRRYALDQLRRYYEQICDELANTDPETLTKITDIVTRFEAIEANVNNTIKLMDDKIKALAEIKGARYTLKTVYDPNTKGIKFELKEV